MANHTNNTTEICTKKSFPVDVYILSYIPVEQMLPDSKPFGIFLSCGWMRHKVTLFSFSTHFLTHKNSPSQIFGIRCSYDLLSSTFSFSLFTSIPANPIYQLRVPTQNDSYIVLFFSPISLIDQLL